MRNKPQYVIQWQHNLGSIHFDGIWHDQIQSASDSMDEAVELLNWTRAECPRLWKGFAHRIVRKVIHSTDVHHPYPVEGLVMHYADLVFRRSRCMLGSDEYDELDDLATDVAAEIDALMALSGPAH